MHSKSRFEAYLLIALGIIFFLSKFWYDSAPRPDPGTVVAAHSYCVGVISPCTATIDSVLL
jgi:hypothetical protein